MFVAEKERSKETYKIKKKKKLGLNWLNTINLVIHKVKMIRLKVFINI